MSTIYPQFAGAEVAPVRGASSHQQFQAYVILAWRGLSRWAILDEGDENVGCGLAPKRVIEDVGLSIVGRCR